MMERATSSIRYVSQRGRRLPWGSSTLVLRGRDLSMPIIPLLFGQTIVSHALSRRRHSLCFAPRKPNMWRALELYCVYTTRKKQNLKNVRFPPRGKHVHLLHQSRFHPEFLHQNRRFISPRSLECRQTLAYNLPFRHVPQFCQRVQSDNKSRSY